MIVMRLIFLLIFIPLATSAYECGRVKVKSSENLIIGSGSTYVEHGEWPWLAPLFYAGSYACSSSLISKRHLLTAAHCLIDHSDPTDYENYYALLGRHNISDDSESDWVNCTMSAVFIHEGYKDDLEEFKSRNDIAVFKMSQGVEFTDFIQPICLPKPSTNTTNVKGYVVGHGFGENDAPEDVAKQARLTSISALKCLTTHRDHHKGVSYNSFCASNPRASLCNGDSGGGFFVLNDRLQFYSTYGVASQVLKKLKSCHAGDVAVFVDVTMYIDWIHAKISVCDDSEECESICELNPCAENASCKALDNGEFTCECRSGFEGDGKSECTPMTTTPRPDFCSVFDCGPNAKCTNYGTFASCACLDNFIGKPPSCRPECIHHNDCPNNRACVNHNCKNLCLSQPCGIGVEKCKMMGHERFCECTAGQRYDESMSKCEPNPNLIDGSVTSDRCCQWMENDWPIDRELQTFAAKPDTKITADDSEVPAKFASSQTEMLYIVACVQDGCRGNIQHPPVKVHRVLPRLLAIFVRRTSVNRVRRVNFEGMLRLQWLSLFDNAISDIDGDAFEDLTELRSLSLSANMLSTLNRRLFATNLKLERLGLRMNRLTEVAPALFKPLGQLTMLHLNRNQLSALHSKQFANLTKLSVLSVGGNRLATLPDGLFAGLAELRDVWLWENGLTKLPADIFKDNAKLTAVHLYGNKISRLNAHVFNGKADLKFVDLQFNVCVDKSYGFYYSSTPPLTQAQRQELRSDIAENCTI